MSINKIKLGFEIGNWNVESDGKGKIGFIQNYNDNREALYELEGGVLILTAMDKIKPAPPIPKAIQSRIVALERHNFRVNNFPMFRSKKLLKRIEEYADYILERNPSELIYLKEESFLMIVSGMQWKYVLKMCAICSDYKTVMELERQKRLEPMEDDWILSGLVDSKISELIMTRVIK